VSRIRIVIGIDGEPALLAQFLSAAFHALTVIPVFVAAGAVLSGLLGTL